MITRKELNEETRRIKTPGGGVISNNCTIEIGDNTTSPISVLGSATVTMEVENQSPTLALNGGSHQADNSGANAVITLKFDADGNVYKKLNTGSYNQIDAGSNWIRPTTAAPDDYEIRYTNATGDTGEITATAAEDTWFAFQSTSPASDFEISVTDTTILAANKSATFDIEIRKGASGGADESASYTLTADRSDI